jgi:hypothetical protein
MKLSEDRSLLFFRILINDRSDCAAAYAAEADRVAGEHDAVGFGTIETLRFVPGTFEGADLA